MTRTHLAHTWTGRDGAFVTCPSWTARTPAVVAGSVTCAMAVTFRLAELSQVTGVARTFPKRAFPIATAHLINATHTHHTHTTHTSSIKIMCNKAERDLQFDVPILHKIEPNHNASRFDGKSVEGQQMSGKIVCCPQCKDTHRSCPSIQKKLC
jgi:hypothetical protein